MCVNKNESTFSSYFHMRFFSKWGKYMNQKKPTFCLARSYWLLFWPHPRDWGRGLSICSNLSSRIHPMTVNFCGAIKFFNARGSYWHPDVDLVKGIESLTGIRRNTSNIAPWCLGFYHYTLATDSVILHVFVYPTLITCGIICRSNIDTKNVCSSISPLFCMQRTLFF